MKNQLRRSFKHRWELLLAIKRQAHNFLGHTVVLASGCALLIVLQDRHAHDLGLPDTGIHLDKRIKGLCWV